MQTLLVNEVINNEILMKNLTEVKNKINDYIINKNFCLG